MSCRKNSMRNKSDRKEVDLFREEHTPERERVWVISKGESSLEIWPG